MVSVPDILIIEDEASIADTLVYVLRQDGHSTHWVTLARDGLAHLRQKPADLVVLDVGLPDMNGFDVCREIRRQSDVPVLILTARGEEIDRIVGLEIGADDYVVKPFSPREVAARVRTIIRRNNLAMRPSQPPTEEASPETTQNACVDQEQARITWQGLDLNLTPTEFHMLNCLLSQPGRIFSRDQLLSAAGTATYSGYERNVDTHIKTLRSKLREVDASSDPIRTHRGFGYSWQDGT